jgi:hypothetical protein
LAAVLAACVSGPDIDLRDEGVVVPALRVHVRPSSQPLVGPAANTAVVEASYAAGTVAGIDDYELLSLQGRAQVGTDPGEPLSARLLGGVEFAWMRLEEGSTSAKDEGFGPMLGTEVSWHCLEPLWLYARGTAAWCLPEMTSTQVEAGLSAWPVERCELFVAFRWWRVRREEIAIFGSDSDLDLRTDGLVLGAGIVF